MLPDFPSVKQDLADRLDEFLRRRVQQHLGPLGQAQRVTLFEGDEQVIVRPSGEVDATKFEKFSTSLTLADQEIIEMTLDDLLAKLDAVAKEMASQQARSFYSTISDAVEKVGNVVDSGGEPISGRTVLESLSTLHIDFNRDGTPRMPSFHAAPDLAKDLKRAYEELEESPELQGEYEQMITDKREEWRAREARRRLVG